MIPGTIILGDAEDASNTDILQGTRLQNAPSNGVVTFQMSATVSVPGTNAHLASIQLPSGSTPINGVPVPANAVTTQGILDDRMMLQVSFPIAQGGHVVFSTALTGVSVMTWRVTFTPLGVSVPMR